MASRHFFYDVVALSIVLIIHLHRCFSEYIESSSQVLVLDAPDVKLLSLPCDKAYKPHHQRSMLFSMAFTNSFPLLTLILIAVFFVFPLQDFIIFSPLYFDKCKRLLGCLSASAIPHIPVFHFLILHILPIIFAFHLFLMNMP